ncbi:MAG TPA: VWA domain-containing protein [Acidobacteriaceae bacterium]|jgi:Ca-activated chloride channel family protein
MMRFAAELALLTLSATAGVAQQEPTFHVEVPLVNVFVSVTDKAGAPIGGLTKDDFLLYENGKAQNIAVFERDTSAPLAIVLAVDLSGSVYKDFAQEQSAAQRFAKDVLRRQDRADVVAFADGTREVTGFTGDAKRIGSGLGELHPGAGGTAFYSTVSLASGLLKPEHGRRVLVMISDGDNTVNGVSYQDALDEAVRDEVMIYSVIDVPVAASAGRDLAGEHAMITLAEQTGGRAYYADQASLDQIFRRIADDLRTQYLLGYYPHKPEPGEDGGFRSIAVKMSDVANNAKYSVRNRPGYYANAPR